MAISDDAVLEFMFNPGCQGLPLNNVSVDTEPKYKIPEETLERLKAIEKEAIMYVEEKKEIDKGLSLLNECIELEPHYASAYNNRAQIYRLNHQLDKAMSDLNYVIDKVGQGQSNILSQAYTQRAIIKKQQGDLTSKKDFEMGASFGNPIARQVAVQENPFAKMCNQVMLEVMTREKTRGYQ